MDHKEAGKYWNRNADAWTQLARASREKKVLRILGYFRDVRAHLGVRVGGLIS